MELETKKKLERSLKYITPLNVACAPRRWPLLPGPCGSASCDLLFHVLAPHLHPAGRRFTLPPLHAPPKTAALAVASCTDAPMASDFTNDDDNDDALLHRSAPLRHPLLPPSPQPRSSPPTPLIPPSPHGQSEKPPLLSLPSPWSHPASDPCYALSPPSSSPPARRPRPPARLLARPLTALLIAHASTRRRKKKIAAYRVCCTCRPRRRLRCRFCQHGGLDSSPPSALTLASTLCAIGGLDPSCRLICMHPLLARHPRTCRTEAQQPSWTSSMDHITPISKTDTFPDAATSTDYAPVPISQSSAALGGQRRAECPPEATGCFLHIALAAVSITASTGPLGLCPPPLSIPMAPCPPWMKTLPPQPAWRLADVCGTSPHLPPSSSPPFPKPTGTVIRHPGLRTRT
ncbi:hypothetical protein HYPSUDRAFT_200564 [Hypholoma sublateritium FD-334 SS-4]|uniref:Uncharacterized protein n=1 Tax=Hypholoma sublateritium (strain FD-334 SS-4) TaxID=945553 RepID=A0A0D2P6Q4_HYPSF|nr:hypothetical protein HYPSUDRAFT_200564 [Hypholoma sublateritium FD-334 SS-4]